MANRLKHFTKISARIDRYLEMFKKFPATPKIGEEIKWAMDRLKKDDRIIWYLKQYKNSLENHQPITFKDKLNHYIGMVESIPQMQSYIFDSNKSPEQTFNELEQLEKQVQSKLSESESKIPLQEGIKIFLDLPGDWAWWSLEKGYCEQEAAAMGHCGNEEDYPGDNILSLRRTIQKGNKTYQEPHATFIYNNGYLGEMKGKANEKPKERYHPAIIKLLLDPRIKHIIGGGYAPENNFELSDLSEEQRKEVLKVKPNISEINILDPNLPSRHKYDIAESDSTSSEILKQLASDLDSGIRSTVASNPATPIEVLKQLATDSCDFARAQVALNINTPPEVLEQLAADSEFGVRAQVASNVNTPPEVLEQLATDPSELVRGQVAHNINTPHKEHNSSTASLRLSESNANILTKIAYKRWSEEETTALKGLFISGREEGIPHKQLWNSIADKLDRSPSEVQRKLTRMYNGDNELKKYKQKNWSRESILEQLKDLYINNKEMHKQALPSQLCFTILKVTGPKGRGWFESVDHAIAEAILPIGHPRLEDGSFDANDSFSGFDDALEYVRRGLKRRHVWNLDEVTSVLKALHAADFPLTLPFLTNHHGLYKDTLGMNRKLESFKDVIKKFVEDGSIQSYPELVCTIAPEYIAYYNEDRSRLKLSTEEIRVKKFLDRFKIPYRIPKLGHKLPTHLEEYPHFVPDFIIYDSEENPIAIVEVFGSIADRANAGVNELYQSKIKAKQDFWSSLDNLKFIEIHNNGDRCDLNDRYLSEVFAPFIMMSKKIDLEDLITTDASQCQKIQNKYGASIYYDPNRKKYLITSAGLNLELDKLFELPTYTSANPAVKKVLELIYKKRQQSRNPQHTNPSDGNTNDYQPYPRDPFNDHERWIAPSLNTVYRGI